MCIRYRKFFCTDTLCQWIILLFCCDWTPVQSSVNNNRLKGDHSLVNNALEAFSNKITHGQAPEQNWNVSWTVPVSSYTYAKFGDTYSSYGHGTSSQTTPNQDIVNTALRYASVGACDSTPEKGRSIWVGSETATLHWNFNCMASRCSIECTNGTPKSSQQTEEWSCRTLRNGTLEGTGNKLLRNSSYKCKVMGMIDYNMIPSDDEVSFHTRDGRPYPPSNVQVSNITATSFIVLWTTPAHVDQERVDYYKLNVYKEVPSYPVNTACSLPNGHTLVFNTTKTSKLVTELLPFYKHRVFVYACNQYGHSVAVLDRVITTSPAEPGPCENASLVAPEPRPGFQPSFSVFWSEPCNWNGYPVGTYVNIYGKRPDNPKRNTNFTHFFEAKHKTSMEPSYLKSLTINASNDFNYTVELYVRVRHHSSTVRVKLSNVWNVYFRPGLASVTSQWMSIRPEIWMSTEDETAQATLHLHNGLLNDTNGTIKHIALMVAEKGYQGLRQRQYLSLPNWPKEKNWHSATEGEHVKLYQATPKYFKLLLPEDNATQPFYLGADTCPSVTTTENTDKGRVTDAPQTEGDESYDYYDYYDSRAVHTKDSTMSSTKSPTTARSVVNGDYYCNGPLRKNVEYAVRLRVFTEAGYTDSKEIFFLTGSPSTKPKPFYNQMCFYATVPMVFAASVVIFIWIRRSRRKANGAASAPSPGRKPTFLRSRRLRKNSRRRSISPEKLPKIATRFLSQKTNLEKEFEDLNEISAAWAAKVSCSVGRLQENRLKNRYADVVPYDYNRVKLSSESTSQTDYINASLIQGFSLNVEYIACQGPTMETSNDFWQMVFDQNISLIVMLTSLVENGMAKCCQYFSELSENKEWMDFTLKCTSRLDLANYTVRELELYKKTTQQKREIKHFQFRDWPDFGCPNDIDGILEFCEVLRGNCVLRNYSTTVIHCSAGIGRTGTLIALDILLQYVHYNRKMDVMRTVLRLREQRQWMVRTVEQYAFLYRCLKTAAERHFTTVT